MQIAHRHAVGMGLNCSLLSALSAYIAYHYLWFGITSSSIPLAAAASFISGTLCWLWIISRKKRYNIVRGGIAGLTSMLLTHPLFWYLHIIYLNLCFYYFHCPTCSNCPRPVNLLEAFPAAISFSYASLYYIGWMMLIAGTLIGALIALIQRKSIS